MKILSELRIISKIVIVDQLTSEAATISGFTLYFIISTAARESADNFCKQCVFGLILYIPVNSYGHVGTVSSPNHTFSDKLVLSIDSAVNQYFDKQFVLRSGQKGYFVGPQHLCFVWCVVIRSLDHQSDSPAITLRVPAVFVFVAALLPKSNNFPVKLGWTNSAKGKFSCSKTPHSGSKEARTSDPLIPSKAL